MIVIRRGVRGVDMDGEGGFEFVEDRVCTYISAFLGLGFLSRDVLESLHGPGLCVWFRAWLLCE